MNSKQHNIVWTVILLMGLGLFGWSFYGNETTTHSNPGVASTADVEHVDDGIGLIPIEQIKVGMRVPARNPEVTDAERAKFDDPDPATWRYLKLELVKADEGVLDIEMIRPQEWIKENGAVVGNSIYLEMKELGAVGNAKVLEIDDCPPIQGGLGEVVISTFAHPASHTILDITISDRENSEGETIGVTETHPFWSVNHQTFVPAGQLQVGDQVLTRDGQTKRITSLLPRPGPPERVFNLEVNGEHVFCVGKQQLLVHNFCEADALRRAGLDVDEAVTFIGRRLSSLRPSNSGKIFLIGENQERLHRVADGLSGLDARRIWWKSVDYSNDATFASNIVKQDAAIAYNRILIRELHKRGYTFVDLGSNSSYRLGSRTGHIDYYGHELEVIDEIGANVVSFFGFVK